MEQQSKTLKDLTKTLDGLALSVKRGFDSVDDKLDEIVEILDVRKRVEEHERKIAKLEQALNVKL
ncbi:hypothetical protein MYX84_13135 [Acidobacteria bacterium AH-259-O06]|nr:hypothetical protein [Acidobacteria bacterium AH-259-O06]